MRSLALGGMYQVTLRTGEGVSMVVWDRVRDSEWQASIGTRRYAVGKRPGKIDVGQPAWYWLQLEDKAKSREVNKFSCGEAGTFDDARRAAELDAAKA